MAVAPPKWADLGVILLPGVLRFALSPCGYGGGTPQWADLGVILLPGVLRFALSPGCTLSPFQGDKYAIGSFWTHHYISTLVENIKNHPDGDGFGGFSARSVDDRTSNDGVAVIECDDLPWGCGVDRRIKCHEYFVAVSLCRAGYGGASVADLRKTLIRHMIDMPDRAVCME